jgi:hypothetical protein
MLKLLNITLLISFILYISTSKLCFPRVCDIKIKMYNAAANVSENFQHMIMDANSKKALTYFETDLGMKMIILFRYDLRKGYSIQKVPESKCVSFDIADHMEELCVPTEIKVVGNITIGDNIKCKVLDFSNPVADNKLIIQDIDVFAPIQGVGKMESLTTFSYFHDYKYFKDVYPDQSVFNIPKECSTAKKSGKKIEVKNYSFFKLK